jgi:hypothetical protein
MKINEDGSIQGQTFSGDNYKGEYPEPRKGETYSEYRKRVQQLKKEGFHLGDLSWSDYETYCMGFGYYEDVDPNEEIY